MLRMLVILFLGLTLAVFSQIQQNVKITFVVKTKIISKESKVYITGSSEELGNWQPSKVQMENAGENLWTKTISFPKGKSLEYKFTLGSWEQEALNKDGSVPQNHTLIASKDTVVNFFVEDWKSGTRKIEGRITGNVEYYHSLKGEGIQPRDIIVWLPPDYKENQNKHFPVLYMHDGQNIVDPATSSFGVDWGADETADSLIRSGKMQSIIVVGIYNTSDRFEEYSYTEKGYSYMKFIISKLKPFIDSTYRTLPDRENTATIGSSMGGLISLMLVWEHSDIFGKAACLSPAFKIRQLDYVKKIADYSGPKKDIKLYIDNGGIALEQELRPGVDDAIEELKKKGFEEGNDLKTFFDPEAEHNERAWAKRLWRPMEFMFNSTPQGLY